MAAPTVVIAALAVAGGAVAGVGLERAGVLTPLGEPEAPTAVRADRMPVLDCPEGTPVASLSRGDRVLATGRTSDGGWIEIRSPLDLDGRAWMAAGVLAGDRSLGDLPVRECDQPTVTTTSTSSTTTSTTLAETTTTTRPPDTTLPPTTAPPPTAPPTTIGDSAPELSQELVTPSEVVHEAQNPCGKSNTVTMQVVATDDRGPVSVTWNWTTGPGGASANGTLADQGGSSWAGAFGVPPSAVPAPEQTRVLTLTITARDEAGQVDTFADSITVYDSGACFNAPS